MGPKTRNRARDKQRTAKPIRKPTTPVVATSASISTITASASTSTVGASADRVRAVKRPPLELAAILVRQMQRKHGTLSGRVDRWRGDMSPVQQNSLDRLRGALDDLASGLGTAEEALTALIGTKWVPKGGAPGRKPLPVGIRVRLKDKRYDPEVHGEENDFVVAGVSGTYILIRLASDAEATPIPVIRPWIVLNSDEGDNETDDANSDGDVESGVLEELE